MLGSTLCRKIVECGHIVFRQGRSISAEICVDPVDSDAMMVVLRKIQADTIVNLVALTDVEQCEINPREAYRANVQVVESVVHALDKFNGDQMPHLIQISTDQVYDGQGPHRENRVDPCNVYALSKLAAEFVVARRSVTVLRTNFIGHSHCGGRTGLTDWIINALSAKQRIVVFEDVLFSALHIDMLCQAIELAIRKQHAGIFNVGCRDGGSKAYLAFALAERLGFDASLLTVGHSHESKLRARRPLDMRMNVSHFELYFGFIAPTFESQIDLVAKEYRHAQTAT